MFGTLGYIEDDEPATPPSRITLWRGGSSGTGMARTADRDRAVWFKHRYSEFRKPGSLWMVTVGPDRLVAHFHEAHRSEDEYVIDPIGLLPDEVID